MIGAIRRGIEQLVWAMRCRRGAAAVEMALVLPTFIAVIAGIIQYGSIISTEHLMVTAAREAARSYAVGASSAGQAQSIAQSRLASTGLTYTVTVTTATGANGDEVTVSITVPMADAAIIDVIGSIYAGLGMSGTISATATMRVES